MAILFVGFFVVAIVLYIQTNVEITFPNKEQGVNHTLTITGISRSIPEEQELWAVVCVPEIRRYYPMSPHVVPKANGNWETPVTLGNPNDTPGDKFIIYAILANQTATNEINAWITQSQNDGTGEQGMANLPAGVTIYDEVNVVRIS